MLCGVRARIWLIIAVSIYLHWAAISPAHASLSRPERIKNRIAQIQDLDTEHARINAEYDAIRAQIPARLRAVFQGKNERRGPLTPREAVLKKHYLAAKEKKYFIDPIHELKEQLNKTYLDVYPDTPKEALNAESGSIALSVIPEIARLKKSYKMIFMPVVHNMIMDVGIRKRGACKHWAEDLLTFMQPMQRRFFQVTWGQANPRKLTEHNVAVLFPVGSDFDKGLIIDPWRTGGKPFWVRVTKDKHYKWKQWPGWGVY